MKKLDCVIKKLFWFSLGLSVGFPAGVVAIIYGASNHQYAIMVLGILFAVAGFYVMPILWLQYGEKKTYKSLLLMIEEEHIYSTNDLASQTGKNQEKIREMVKYLINKHYLTGYIFKDDVLQINNNRKQTKEEGFKRCPNCGAKMHYENDHYVCDYCGD